MMISVAEDHVASNLENVHKWKTVGDQNEIKWHNYRNGAKNS